MRHCHICGVEVLDGGHRRVVQTGASRRVHYGKRRTSVTRATSEGPRTLCASCAKSHDRQATFGLVVRLVVFCVAATAIGTAYFGRSQKSGEPVAAIQQVEAPPPPGPQASEAPPTVGSIDAPRENAPGVSVVAVTPKSFPPIIRGDGIMLDPNVPADAEAVQNRLRLLGFPVNDPRGVWSKGTDLALQRFRRSRGLRAEWRWDLPTQAALFSERK
jgi:hypothetical protein